MYKRVLLAYDGSQSGQKALLDCREIVQWSQAELHLIAVMPTTVTPVVADGWAYGAETEPADRAEYEAILAAGLRRLTEAGLSARATTNPSAVCPSLVSIWRSTRGWTHKSVQRIAVAMEGDLVHHAQASAQMQGVEILEGKL